MTKENKNEEIQDTWVNEELSSEEQAQPEQPNWFASNKGILAIVGVFGLIMLLVWMGSGNNNSNATNNNPRQATQLEAGLFDRFSNAYNSLSRAEREGVRLVAWLGVLAGAFTAYKNRAEIMDAWAKFKKDRTPSARAEARVKTVKKEIKAIDKAIARRQAKKALLESPNRSRDLATESESSIIEEKQGVKTWANGSAEFQYGYATSNNPYKDLRQSDVADRVDSVQEEINRFIEQKEEKSDLLIDFQDAFDNAKELEKLYK